jgi:hypothetical protein
MTQDGADPGGQRARQEDQFVSLPHGDRWFVDGFSALDPCGAVVWQLCDMTQAHAALQALRARGVRATYSHLVVRAAALALRRCPEAHQLLCGYTRVRPARVDIGLSVAGQTSYAPVLVIQGADERPLPELCEYLTAKVPATREKEQRDLEGMRRLGWLVPLGFLRRWIMRLLARTFWFRRRLTGTFQITCVPGCDMILPMLFYSGSMLAIGRICERVLAVSGRPEVRLSMWMCIPFDHRAMDARLAAVLLQSLREVLEGPELVAEAGGDPLARRPAPVIGQGEKEPELAAPAQAAAGV